MDVQAAEFPSSPVSPRRWQRLVNILGPTLITLLVAAGTLELGLRHFYQLIPLPVCASDYILGNYYCQPYFIYDKPVQLGYRYEPNMHFEGWWDPADPYLTDVGRETAPSDRSDAFWYVFETDNMGFPNSEPAWQDAYDIIVTGDSFVTRSAPQTWIELLAAQTGQRILTLGASSWSPMNEVEAVKQFGLDKQPKWVILLYFEGNDLLNVQQYLQKQASGLDWREYDLRQVPWYRRLVVYHLLRYYLGGQPDETAEPPRYRYPVTINTEAGQLPTVFKDSHLLPLSADYNTLAASREFAHISAALLEVRDAVVAANGRFLLVYVPSKEHVTWSRIWDPADVNNVLERTVTVSLDEAGWLQWESGYLDYNTFSSNIEAQARLLGDFAAANDIALLDLTPALWEQTIATGELYHYADPHWNQAGNQLVADLIAAWITQAPR
ncbi:MAG: hypothetical protein KC425_04550 [Anaerolineales bacterium]|nr:hypothetical protein [Anaerolineales bacterium]